MDIDLLMHYMAHGVPTGTRSGPIKTTCHTCIHRGNIPGDAHSKCTKPSTQVAGDRHGIQNGWFMYPLNFDPTWRVNECPNHEESK